MALYHSGVATISTSSTKVLGKACHSAFVWLHSYHNSLSSKLTLSNYWLMVDTAEISTITKTKSKSILTGRSAGSLQGRPVGAEIGRQNAFFLGGLQLSRFP